MKQEYKEVLEKRGFDYTECMCVIYDEDCFFYIKNEKELKQFIDDQRENIEVEEWKSRMQRNKSKRSWQT